MERKTQAERLREMMQRHHQIDSYVCRFPYVTLRQKQLEKLSVGDILLTGFDIFELLLESESCHYHIGAFDTYQKGIVLKRVEHPQKISSKPKEKVVEFSFGTLSLETLHKGESVDLSSLDLEDVTIKVDQNELAKGHLVNVDGTIAVMIDQIQTKVR